ncbi:MAG: rcc01693 family protein [Rhodoblastus sp.]
MTAVSSRSPSERFPWREAMRFGLGVLRLAPEDFWSSTPRELHAASQGMFGVRAEAAPSRDKLDALMRDFPDGG